MVDPWYFVGSLHWPVPVRCNGSVFARKMLPITKFAMTILSKFVCVCACSQNSGLQIYNAIVSDIDLVLCSKVVYHAALEIFESNLLKYNVTETNCQPCYKAAGLSSSAEGRTMLLRAPVYPRQHRSPCRLGIFHRHVLHVSIVFGGSPNFVELVPASFGVHNAWESWAMGGTPASQAIVAESQTATNLGWCPEVDEETRQGKKRTKPAVMAFWVRAQVNVGSCGISSHTGHSRPLYKVRERWTMRTRCCKSLYIHFKYQ